MRFFACYNRDMTAIKILLVDDDIFLRDVVRSKLADEGFIVSEAGTADEALKISSTEKPAAILTDIVMFPTDGISFIKMLRLSSPWGANVPCFIYSGQAEKDVHEEIKSIDIVQFFNKGLISPDEVAKKIKKHLNS